MIATVALVVAVAALLLAAFAAAAALSAHRDASWAATTIRAAASGRAGKRVAAQQGRHSQPSADGSQVEPEAPVYPEARPEPPTVAERDGGTREYRAVPPPGGWAR